MRPALKLEQPKSKGLVPPSGALEEGMGWATEGDPNSIPKGLWNLISQLDRGLWEPLRQ